MEPFANIQDIIDLWRHMTPEETGRATALLPVVSDRLRLEAENVGKDLDLMVAESTIYANVVKTVTVDITSRAIKADLDQLPVTQMSEAAMGYSVQQTFQVPNDSSIFVKKSELSALKLRKQRYGVIDFYGQD
jgi:hypothetical protein